ncbi:hypothetical protein HHX47_DHR3000156 [Lentinula edodes]|nr:hypothetical protein HHX47_DHR3000156 [Lentinula edodes]
MQQCLTTEGDLNESDSNNSNNSPNQGNDSAGPRGGAGTEVNSASGSSDQDRSSGGGSSNARTKRSLGPTYSQRDNKRPRQHSDFQVILNASPISGGNICFLTLGFQELHLAFNCPRENLLSHGFSEYSVIPMPVSVPSGTDKPPRRGSFTTSIGSSSGASSSGTTANSIENQPLFSPHSGPVVPEGIAATRSTDNSLTQPASQSIVESSNATSVIESSSQKALPIVDHAGVILDTKVHQSTKGIVWGGKMYLEGLKPAPKPVHVVVKLADWERDSEAPEGSQTPYGKSLCYEAKIYHHLVGSNIGPHFYGVFNNSGSIALVLEYKGKRLPDFGTLTDDRYFHSCMMGSGIFSDIAVFSFSRKQMLFNQACNLHSLGVKHKYLAPRNVLVNKEGDLTIVDFHRSKLGHKCKGSRRCSELRDFAEHLQIVV